MVLHTAARFALARKDLPSAQSLWRGSLQLLGEPPRPRRLAAGYLSNLSRTEARAGRYGDAADSAQRGLALLIPGKAVFRHRQLLAALHNECGVAFRLAGSLNEAAIHYRCALAGCGEGRLHRAMASAVYHNLGGLAFAEGRYRDAERLTQHALELKRSLPWPAPLGIAADLGMLGAIVAANGRLDEGESLLRKALATFTQRLGPTDREIAIALGNLAEVRRLRGDYRSAAHLAVRALSIGKQSMGPEHPELAAIVNTLAIARYAQGYSEEAAKLLTTVIQSLEAHLDEDHPALRTCRANLLAMKP